ncbi:MAG: hypothetical protein ACRDWW_00610 [Acidimicrobiales bacterium]
MSVRTCVSTCVSTYSFRCPACRSTVAKEASVRIVDALTRAGVEVVRWSLPAEMLEERHGPPITHDDILAFHIALQDGAMAAELASIGWKP